MDIPKKDTKTVPPLVKNRLRTPVKIKMKINGFMPRKNAFAGIPEIPMQVSKKTSINP